MRRNDVDLLGSYWTLAGGADPTGSGAPEWSPFDFENRVETAADVGFDGIGLWHADLEHVLEERSLAEMRAVLDDHDVRYVELEFLDFWFLDEDDDRRRAADERWTLLLEAADALDAHHIKVGNMRGIETPIERLSEAFDRLCADAAAHDTRVGYEMMPVDALTELDEVLAVVEGPDNGGILLDTWHVVKMGVPFDDLRVVRPEQLVGVELNDGYVDSDRTISDETTSHRLLPGEGEFDVPRFVDVLRDVGYDGPWGVEVLSADLRELPMTEAYERTYEATVAQFE